MLIVVGLGVLAVPALTGTQVGLAWQVGSAVVAAATIAATLTLVARRRGRPGTGR